MSTKGRFYVSKRNVLFSLFLIVITALFISIKEKLNNSRDVKKSIEYASIICKEDSIKNQSGTTRFAQSSPAFKARIALEAMRSENTLVELAQQCNLLPTQISDWRRQLMERAPEIFENPHQTQRTILKN